MANATDKPPSTDELIAEFKGVSTENAEVVAVQDSRPRGASVNNEEGNTEENQAQETQQRQPPAGVVAPKQKSAQDRIDQAVKRQREAERRADMAEGRLQAFEQRFSQLEARLGGQPLTTQQQQNNSVDPQAPDPARYQYGELDGRYIADLARYEAGKVIENERQSRQQETRAAQIEQERQMVTDFGAKGAEKYADFVETVIESGQRKEWPLSDTVGKLAFDSEFGHDILYALATNPDEAKRVDKLPPAKQAAWFGQQEAKWSAASPAANRGQPGQRQQANGQNPPVRTTQAPPPPQVRLRGAGNVNPVSSDTTDFAAFEALAMGRTTNH